MTGQSLVGRRGALVLCSAFFYIGSVMLVNPLITGYTESLGATVAATGVIAAVMSACSLACRPVAGTLANRMSKGRLAIAGASLMCVSCVGYALAVTPVQIGVLRVTHGIGYSFCSVCASTWFAEMLPASRIGAGMGVFGMMNALAMAVGPALGLAVYGAWGYRAALLSSAALAAGSLVAMALVRDGAAGQRREGWGGRGASDSSCRDVDSSQGTAEGASNLGSAHRFLSHVADARAVPAAAVVALFTIPYCAVQSYLVQSVAARGLAVTTGLFFPTYAAALLVLRAALRNEFDRRPFGMFALAGAVSELVSLALLCAMRSNVALVASAVLMAGGYGVMCSVCQATAVRLVGSRGSGMANGTYYMGLDIGMFAGLALGGVAYSALGPGLAFLALAPALGVAVLVWIVCRGRLDGCAAPAGAPGAEASLPPGQGDRNDPPLRT